MVMNKDLSDKYMTSNFYTAVFCFVRGLRLVDIDRSDPRRSQFVFLDGPDREKIVQSFDFAQKDAPEVLVDVREFISAIKVLKDKLYQNL